jgi:uncharacterized Fe-S center protein
MLFLEVLEEATNECVCVEVLNLKDATEVVDFLQTMNVAAAVSCGDCLENAMPEYINRHWAETENEIICEETKQEISNYLKDILG